MFLVACQGLQPPQQLSTPPTRPTFWMLVVQVVGCIVEHQGRVLLCKRAIEPCRGLWTLPAGYLEIGEGSAAGAARETWEEACARVEVCMKQFSSDS